MEALNILVVEDDAMIGELLAEVIVELGHMVCAIVATEIGAVAAAAWHKPDLMIVDAQLGYGSGIAAVETILRDGPVPHLFVSGNIAKVLALRPWAVALQKPYTEAALLVAMKRALAATH
jgi:CheY-like chemotaxis protein